jgi:hypothetical protein
MRTEGDERMKRRNWLAGFAGVIGAGALLSPRPARAASPPILKLGPGNHVADLSWDGKEIWFDLWGQGASGPNQGRATIYLPAAGTLPDGWSCIIHKHDPMSHVIEVRPTVAGDRLNHFWTKDSQFGRMLNLTQQSARLSCDGVQDYVISGMTLHRNVPQSHRTVTGGLTWWLSPESENEIVRCDATNGPIAIIIHGVAAWCPPSPLLGGNHNYHAFSFQIQKADSSPHWVSVWMGDGSPIRFANGAQCQPGQGHDGYVLFPRAGDTGDFYMAADGCSLNGFYRPAWQHMGP